MGLPHHLNYSKNIVHIRYRLGWNMAPGVPETKYCNVTFRYYTPHDSVLKKQILPHSGVQHIEERIERDINDSIHKIEKEVFCK